MTAEVVVADRFPVTDGEGISGGAMVRSIYDGLISRPTRSVTTWVSPVARVQPTPRLADGLAIRQLPVGQNKLDRYYLDVGAGRMWMVLHSIIDALPFVTLEDNSWESFVEVNKRVAIAVAKCAAKAARVNIHDYTLLLSVPEIRKRRPDVTLAYVHHVPWPHRDSVRDIRSRELVGLLAAAAEAADGVAVSARQWNDNLRSWSSTAQIGLAHPGINRAELQRRLHSSAGRGHWTGPLGKMLRPIVAAVGRVDPTKNFDNLLRAWISLISSGAQGTVCLHLVPTSRRRLPAYRAYAESVASLAREANHVREGSVIIIEEEAQTDALQLLQAADIVVACSRSDGWNLVALEAAALGPDTQHLILSGTVGAVEVLSSIAEVVKDPLDLQELVGLLGSVIVKGTRRSSISRTNLPLPSPKSWTEAVDDFHNRAEARRQQSAG